MYTINKVFLIYPAIFMMLLALFLYTKNYLANKNAVINGDIKFSYFKDYKGEVPYYVSISRQTLKNQFELPVFFYFLISIIIAFDSISFFDLILAWLFVISRYLHCYIRLSSNNIKHRSKSFTFGLLILVVWWIIFLFRVINY